MEQKDFEKIYSVLKSAQSLKIGFEIKPPAHFTFPTRVYTHRIWMWSIVKIVDFLTIFSVIRVFMPWRTDSIVVNLVQIKAKHTHNHSQATSIT